MKNQSEEQILDSAEIPLAVKNIKFEDDTHEVVLLHVVSVLLVTLRLRQSMTYQLKTSNHT